MSDMRLIIQPIDYGIPNDLIKQIEDMTNQKGRMNASLLIQWFNQGVQEINAYGFRFPKITQADAENTSKGYWTINMLYKPLPEPYFTNFFLNYISCKLYASMMMTQFPNYQVWTAAYNKVLKRIIGEAQNIDPSYKVDLSQPIGYQTHYRSRF